MTKFTSNLKVLPSKSENIYKPSILMGFHLSFVGGCVSCLCFVAFPRAIKLARIFLVSSLSIKVTTRKGGERVKNYKIMILIPFENAFLDGNGVL